MCFFKKWREKRKEKKVDDFVPHVEATPLMEKDVIEEPVVTPEPQLEPIEKPTPKTKTPKYHVSQNKDSESPQFKKWRVRKEGSSKTIKYFDTQKDAILYAQDLADNAGSSIVIHKVDGTIRKQTYIKK